MKGWRKIVLSGVVASLAVVCFFVVAKLPENFNFISEIFIILTFIVTTAILLAIDIEHHGRHLCKQKKHINEIYNRIKKLEEHMQQADLDPLILSHSSTKTNDDELQLSFRKQLPGFVPQLRLLVPRITPGEENLCMMIKLNMTTREIAHVLNIDIKSVHTARARLKRKLLLENDMSLDEWVKKIIIANNPGKD